MRFLSMAALALVGAVMTGCSSDDNLIDQPQQAESKGNVVTMKTTVSLDGRVSTRALTSEGVKTFAAGDKIAVVYTNTSDETKVAESNPLAAGDITGEGKSATFTVSLTNAKASTSVTYIYPAAMAKDDGTVNYDALKTQDGTLTTLASDLDLATGTGTLTATGGLPTTSVSMTNPLAILALTLKNSGGSSDITSTITSLSVGDGTNIYSVSRSAAAGPIYVAIKPTTTAIGINATDGTNNYCKQPSTTSYDASNGYSLSLKMAQGAHLAALTGDFTAKSGDMLTGTLNGSTQPYKISIAADATVTLDGATINGVSNFSYNWAGINCEGNATIILKDGSTNTVTGFYEDYPGIHVLSGSTLTIQGDGSLKASSNSYGAGIGGGTDINCGNIEIKGGTITAIGGSDRGAGIGSGFTGSCGTITISGGTVTATGGDGGAGIGSGYYESHCGTITISGGTVTATGGDGGAGIGSGYSSSSCGNITISGGTVKATGSGDGAGIGSGYSSSSCGDITITAGVTKVTATKGSGYAQSIGSGFNGSCGAVSIASGANVTQN